MSTIQIEVPDEVLQSLQETPETISRELLLLAAIKLYELGKLPFERAAQLSGVSYSEFLDLLAQYGVSPFDISSEEREAIAQLKTLLKETQAIHAENPLTEEEIAAEIDAVSRLRDREK